MLYMDTIYYGTGIGALLLMQAMIIWECIRMKGTVSTETTSLRTAMADMGTLLDEALDYIAELGSAKQPSPIVRGAGESIQEVLLTGLMNRMMMPQNYGSETQPQERTVHEEYTQTNQEEI